MTMIQGTDLPPRGSKPWYDAFLSAWNVLRGRTSEHENLITSGRLSSAAMERSAADSRSAVPLTAFVTTPTAPARYDDVLMAAVASGERIYIPRGRFLASATFENTNVDIEGPGVIVQPKENAGANALRIRHVPIRSFPAVAAKQNLAWYSATAMPADVETTPALLTYEPQTIRLVAPNQADVAATLVGDSIFVRSTDYYDADFLATGNPALHTYMSWWLKVMGYGLTVSVAGTAPISSVLPEGLVIKGQTSNAEGAIGSSTTTFNLTSDRTKALAVLKSIQGTFVVGENLLINGAVVGTVSALPYILASGDMPDSPTNVTVDIAPRGLVTRIRGTFEASGDVNQTLGVPNARASAIELIGATDVDIDAHIRSAWGRALRTSGVYGGDIRVKVDMLANDTRAGEEVYGYAVDARGATTGVAFFVNARQCRHAATTNVAAKTSYPTSAEDLLATGLPSNNVFRGVARDTYAAAWDTHGGARNTTFLDVVAFFSNSLGKRETESVVIQDRGMGTKVIGGRGVGATVGIKAKSHTFVSPLPWRNEYRGFTAENIAALGIHFQGTAADSQGEYVIDGGGYHLDGAAITPAGPGYSTPFQIEGAGVSVRITGRPQASGFATPLRVLNAPARVEVDGYHPDYSRSPTGATAARFDGKPAATVSVNDYKPRDPGSTQVMLLRTEVDNLAVRISDSYVLERNVDTINSADSDQTVAERKRSNAVLIPRSTRLIGSKTWDWPSTSTSTKTTLRVKGARKDMPASARMRNSTGSNVDGTHYELTATVISYDVTSGYGTVEVTLTALSGTVDLASNTLEAIVWAM